MLQSTFTYSMDWSIYNCVKFHILPQVNISTIAGSRHVGPIKPRVEEWVRQLSLFSETLVSMSGLVSWLAGMVG